MIGRECKYCKAKMKGRADKQYCNTACKNAYNYDRKRAGSISVRAIDKILHTNHKVMEQIFEGEKIKHFKVSKIALSKMGFNFSYHTGTYLNSRKKTYHYIYDYSWMEFSNQEVMVVKGKSWKLRD